MNHLVFAYGTLLVPAVQSSVMGRLIEGTPDRLAGYRKTRIQDGADSYPNLAPDANSEVEGRVIEVTQRELDRIDMYEGALYSRHKVTLKSGTEAWAYFA